jgi:hypothetical protein
MAPHRDVMNVWLAPAGDSASARRMTNATDRPIPTYFYAPDSRSLLYIQDKAGDENFLLYQVDLESGAERCLTPFENTRVRADLVVSKTTDGESTFVFDFDCDGTEYYGHLHITTSNGSGSACVPDVPTWTSCTVTEVEHPLFTTTVIPSDGTVLIEEVVASEVDEEVAEAIADEVAGDDTTEA